MRTIVVIVIASVYEIVCEMELIQRGERSTTHFLRCCSCVSSLAVIVGMENADVSHERIQNLGVMGGAKYYKTNEGCACVRYQST